jgi:hypothetical protein
LFNLLFIDQAEERIKNYYLSQDGGASFATAHGIAMIYSAAKMPWSDGIIDML